MINEIACSAYTSEGGNIIREGSRYLFQMTPAKETTDRASSKFFRPNRGFLWRTTWRTGL